MNHSENITELAKALHKAQGELEFAKKDAVNPHFNSRYADLWRIWQVAKAPLQNNGLVVTQTFDWPANTERNGETVTIVTTLLHVSGQWIESNLTLKPTKPDPQGIGSAITYGKRYSLSSILGIVADEDDDGNQASSPTPKTPAKALGTPVLSLPKAWSDWSNEERGEFMATKGSKTLKEWFLSLPTKDQANLELLKEDWKATAAGIDAKAKI